MKTARIYKDAFFPSRIWNCDLTDDDGKFWFKWQSMYRTRKSLIAAIHGFDGDIKII